MNRDARDHPLDEPQKSYHTILEQETTQAEEELGRPAIALLLAGLTAGLDVGFGPLAMVVNSTLTRDVLSKPMQELLNANLYSIGFVFVVLGRSALYTEHTTSAVLPFFAGRVGARALFRLWGLVLTANLAGAALFALGASRLAPALGMATPDVMGELAAKVVSPPTSMIFFSAIGAGWLLGLLTWLAASARETVSQLVVIWLTTMLIGLTGMHHSVAGATEVLMGVFLETGVTWRDFVRFEVAAATGNAVGGVVFVGLLKFSHIRAST